MKTHEPIDYLRSSIPGSIRLKSRTSRIQRISRNNRNRLIPNGDGLISLENCVTISTQNSEACPVWSTVGPEQTEPFYLSGWDKKYDMSVCLATTKPDSQQCSTRMQVSSCGAKELAMSSKLLSGISSCKWGNTGRHRSRVTHHLCHPQKKHISNSGNFI